jgi:molybdopterin synthase catalytic subunit
VADAVALTADPLSLDALVAAVTGPEHGALVTFTGVTRREAGAREVVALEYEAYEPLALRELRAVADETAARFGVRVAVAHRVGSVAVGEPSVAIAVGAGHRAAAFAGCRHAIDAIKSRVPVWKRVRYADGGAEWRDDLSAPVT